MGLAKNKKSEFIKLHNENAEKLLGLVDGNVSMDNPKPITLENASCVIAQVIHNNTKMLSLVNPK